MITQYGRLLKQPTVPRLMALNTFAKLCSPMLGVALLLAAMARFDSFGLAGSVLTAHAFAVAAGTPVGGRLLDRYGKRRVIACYVGAHSVAYVGVLLAFGSSPAALLAAAVLLGASTPPVGPLVRAALPQLVSRETLPSAYALDSGINEIMFVLGPLLVAVLTAVLPAVTVVVVTGVVIVAASALLLAVPAIARAEPEGARPLRQSRVGRVVGPLGDRRVLTLLFLAAFGTFGFGALRIATAASAATLGVPSVAGVLMGLLSVGALIGALGYGARTWRTSSRRLLIVVSAAEAGAMAIGVLAVEFIALSVVIVAIGLLGGVRDSVVPTLLADQTRHHHRTEVFAWLTTFMWIGYGLGTSLAGAVTGPTDNGGHAFVLATAVLTVGVLLALSLRHTAAPPTTTDRT